MKTLEDLTPRELKIPMMPMGVGKSGEEFYYGVLWAVPPGTSPKAIKCEIGECKEQWSGAEWPLRVTATYQDDTRYSTSVDLLCPDHFKEWVDSIAIVKECELDTRHIRDGKVRDEIQDECRARKHEEEETGHYDPDPNQ